MFTKVSSMKLQTYYYNVAEKLRNTLYNTDYANATQQTTEYERQAASNCDTARDVPRAGPGQTNDHVGVTSEGMPVTRYINKLWYSPSTSSVFP